MLDPQMLLHGFAQGSSITVAQGFPEDTVCVGASFDIEKRMFTIYGYHPSFDIVPEDKVIPEIDVVVDKTRA